MNNIAIITARSGSKGLKDKNIKLLSGKPMLAYTVEAALQSKMFDEVMVSTDSEKYAEIAREYGAVVPFMRSLEQSSDGASSWDVVKEVLSNYKKQGKTFDTICLLQPTSPLRTAQNIIEAYQDLAITKGNAITSMCEMDHSPKWATILPENKCIDVFRQTLADVPRQQISTYYRINGAIYIRRIRYGNEIELLESEEYAYVMDKQDSIDIDTQFDFDIAEALMSKR